MKQDITFRCMLLLGVVSIFCSCAVGVSKQKKGVPEENIFDILNSGELDSPEKDLQPPPAKEPEFPTKPYYFRTYRGPVYV